MSIRYSEGVGTSGGGCDGVSAGGAGISGGWSGGSSTGSSAGGSSVGTPGGISGSPLLMSIALRQASVGFFSGCDGLSTLTTIEPCLKSPATRNPYLRRGIGRASRGGDVLCYTGIPAFARVGASGHADRLSNGVPDPLARGTSTAASPRFGRNAYPDGRFVRTRPEDIRTGS